MKLISEKIKLTTSVFLLAIGLSATGCSTGTSDGATNVEESDGKDKNPTEHNQTSAQPMPKDTAQMGDAYERTDGDTGARDADNDGKVDQ